MADSGPFEVDVVLDVEMRTRDGVRLLADIYRPRTVGSFPVLVHRTPYNKRGGAPYPDMDKEFNDAHLFASHGYLVVVQDVRGRFASDGVFVPFVNEAKDGYDTVEWAASLDGSSGDVGMFGQSYDAMCQYLAASMRPPHLRTAIPVSAPINYFDHCVYTSGAFNLAWMLHYVLINLALRGQDADVALKALREYVLDPDLPAKRRMDPEHFKDLPISLWSERLADFAPYFADYVNHGTEDEFWRHLDMLPHMDDIDVTMLHVSSWYDGFQKGSMGAFTGLTAAHGPGGQSLVMGPWAHTIYTNASSGKAGGVDFGEAAGIELRDMQLDWLNRHLKQDASAGDMAPVRLFVMGANTWRDEQEWPLARTAFTPLYLRSGDDGGVLSWERPGEEEPDSFTYDPDDPVPTIGGHHLGVFGLPNGPYDQRPTLDRNDVLVYTTDALVSDLEITGPVSAVLHASSSAPDTDFVVKLIDVAPDGAAHPITEGILRARFRESLAEPKMLEPGEVYELTVDLYALSHVVPAGHRLRVHVTSSDFPQWDANPNTGHAFGTSADVAVADQRVFHDSVRPSHILLPVIPAAPVASA